mmetsp:Transcript_1062/g.4382  ORF Transcript_1062/g.4382 Transcript_1062/m.4382 type:complete len:478 (-) Transcript_1062:243-1676(-)
MLGLTGFHCRKLTPDVLELTAERGLGSLGLAQTQLLRGNLLLAILELRLQDGAFEGLGLCREGDASELPLLAGKLLLQRNRCFLGTADLCPHLSEFRARSSNRRKVTRPRVARTNLTLVLEHLDLLAQRRAAGDELTQLVLQFQGGLLQGSHLVLELCSGLVFGVALLPLRTGSLGQLVRETVHDVELHDVTLGLERGCLGNCLQSGDLAAQHAALGAVQRRLLALLLEGLLEKLHLGRQLADFRLPPLSTRRRIRIQGVVFTRRGWARLRCFLPLGTVGTHVHVWAPENVDDSFLVAQDQDLPVEEGDSKLALPLQCRQRQPQCCRPHTARLGGDLVRLCNLYRAEQLDAVMLFPPSQVHLHLGIAILLDQELGGHGQLHAQHLTNSTLVHAEDHSEHVSRHPAALLLARTPHLPFALQLRQIQHRASLRSPAALQGLRRLQGGVPLQIRLQLVHSLQSLGILLRRSPQSHARPRM